MKTHIPIFCNRDSKIVYSLAEVLRERRDGYGWYTYQPQQVLDRYAAWRLKNSERSLTVAADGSGDYRTVQAAFDACQPQTTIYIKGGVYHEKLLPRERNLHHAYRRR